MELPPTMLKLSHTVFAIENDSSMVMHKLSLLKLKKIKNYLKIIKIKSVLLLV